MATFRDFLLRDYIPASCERLADDTNYLPGSTYPQICQTRTGLLYQALTCHLRFDRQEGISHVLDIGPYPGTQARALKQFFGTGLRLSGAGLFPDEAFAAEMTPVFDRLCTVDLDPFYAGLAKPIRIDFPDSSFDAIYALEIFEHFISPLAFIAECARMLKPGAILCLSTPNVSHIGAIYQLLLGHSNHEALAASPMFQSGSTWRGHFRIYAKRELIELFARQGLELIHHEYYHEAGSACLRNSAEHALRTTVRNGIGWLVPHFREDQFLIFRRKADAQAIPPRTPAPPP